MKKLTYENRSLIGIEGRNMIDKIKFKTGMTYKSETHPQFDMEIDFMTYMFNDEGKINKYGTVICWNNINREEFDKFLDLKLGVNRKSTFPYPWSGECGVNGIKQRIKKYNLKFIGMSDKEVKVYDDNEYEYCSGYKEF